MAYVTQTDLELACGGPARLVEIADWHGVGSADAAVVADAIDAACGWIDGYARLRYGTPIPSPTATIKRVVAAEAIYVLRERRQMLTEQDVATKTARDQWAADLRDGKVRPDEPLPAPSTAIRSAWRPSTRDTSRDKLKGFS